MAKTISQPQAHQATQTGNAPTPDASNRPDAPMLRAQRVGVEVEAMSRDDLLIQVGSVFVYALLGAVMFQASWWLAVG